MGKNGCREGVSLFQGGEEKGFFGIWCLDGLTSSRSRSFSLSLLQRLDEEASSAMSSSRRGRNAGWVPAAATATSVASTASPGQGSAPRISVHGLSLALLPVCRHSLS